MARYARRIEQRWSELLGSPVVLSRRDWSELRRWHDLGIPLEIVNETMTAVFERDRRSAKPPRLTDLARKVEEAWSVIVDGRVGDAHGVPPGPDPIARWRERRAAEHSGSALADLLDELIERSDRGESAAAIDAALDLRLTDSVTVELRAAAVEAVEGMLSPYRDRIRDERLESTRQRAVVERLRRRLDLPRLAQGASPD